MTTTKLVRRINKTIYSIAVLAMVFTIFPANVNAATTITVNAFNPDLKICAAHSACPSVQAPKAEFTISKAGKYELYADVYTNSADTQLNESFYLELKEDSGARVKATDANAGNYFVIDDYAGMPAYIERYAGTYNFSAGDFVIDASHYYLIKDSYPAFINPNFGNGESVMVKKFKLVLIEEETQPDPVNLSITKKVKDMDESYSDHVTSATGEYIYYNITIKNTSNTNASGVVITDDYDQNKIEIITDDYGTDNGDTIIWYPGHLNAGHSLNKTIKARILDNTHNSTFSNTASTYSKTVSPISASATVTVKDKEPDPDPANLTIEKLVKDSNEDYQQEVTSEVSEYVYYKITVKNTGDSKAIDVTLTDEYNDTYLDLVSDNSGSNSGNVITWNLGDMNPNQSITKTIKAKITDDASNKRFVNKATVSSNSVSPISDTAYVDVDEIVEDDEVYLTIDKQVDDTRAEPGDTIHYTIRYEVKGTGTAFDVVLEDDYSQNQLDITNDDGAQDNGSYLTWDLGDLSAGSSGTKYITARLDSDLRDNERVDNKTEISADNASTKKDSVRTYIDVDDDPDDKEPQLSLSKRVSDNDETNKVINTATEGETIFYELTIRNYGDGDAKNVVLKDNFDSYRIDIEDRDGASKSGDVLTWRIGTLDAGESITKEIRAQVKHTGLTKSFNNDVFVTASNASSRHDSVTTKVETAEVVNDYNVALEKFVSDDNEKEQKFTTSSRSETLTYKIVLKNIGDEDLYDLRLVDDYDQNYLNITSTNSGKNDGNTISWDISRLRKNQTITKTLKAQIKSNFTGDVNIQNIVQVNQDSSVLDYDRVNSFVERTYTVTKTGTVLGASTAPTTGPGAIFAGIATFVSTLTSAGYVFLKSK